MSAPSANGPGTPRQLYPCLGGCGVLVEGPTMKCRNCAGAAVDAHRARRDGREDVGAPGEPPVPGPGAAGPATTHPGDGRHPPARGALPFTPTPEQAELLAAALDAARALARAGIPVFVAYPDPDPDSKTGFKLPPNWQKTRADPRYVDAWRPGMALCMVTGHGLDVNDIDPRNGGTLEALETAVAQRGGSLPRVYGVVATPSGGEHDYIKSLGLRKATGFLPGIDYQGGDAGGTGRGFVFLPPTVRKSKVTGELVAYRWVHPLNLAGIEDDTSGEALRALLLEADRPGPLAGRQNGPRPDAIPEEERARRVAAEVARQRRKWAGKRIAKGRRNDWLYRRACALRGAGANEEEILALLRELNAEHCDPPVDDNELARIAASAHAGYEPNAATHRAGDGLDWSRIDWPRCDQTDTGNAELLGQVHGDRLRYDPGRGRWLLWRPGTHRWTEPVGGEVERLYLEAVEYRFARARELEPGPEAKAEIAYAHRSRDHPKIKNALARAQETKPIDAGAALWDQHRHLLAVTNGVIDLRTGVLRDGRPEDRITRGLEIAYDPAATCPRFERFLEEICDGDRELVAYLWRAIGYTLTGETREQVLFVLLGSGANGKSVLLSVLGALLGDFGTAIPSAVLCEGEGRAPLAEVAAIDGRRLVTCAEVNVERLNVDRIKALTGGDVVAGRPLYRPLVNFEPAGKIWLATNGLRIGRGRDGEPDGGDEAFERRIHLIRLPRSFTGPDCDPHLVETLKGELQGIFARGVRGAVAWYAHGLQPPEGVLFAGWRVAEGGGSFVPLDQFIREACVVGPGLKLRAREGYAAYRQVVVRVGGEPMSETRFGRLLRERFHKKKEPAGFVYLGVGLAPEPEPGAAPSPQLQLPPSVWCQTPTCSQALDPGAACPTCGVVAGSDK